MLFLPRRWPDHLPAMLRGATGARRSGLGVCRGSAHTRRGKRAGEPSMDYTTLGANGAEGQRRGAWLRRQQPAGAVHRQDRGGRGRVDPRGDRSRGQPDRHRGGLRHRGRGRPGAARRGARQGGGLHQGLAPGGREAVHAGMGGAEPGQFPARARAGLCRRVPAARRAAGGVRARARRDRSGAAEGEGKGQISPSRHHRDGAERSQPGHAVSRRARSAVGDGDVRLPHDAPGGARAGVSRRPAPTASAR